MIIYSNSAHQDLISGAKIAVAWGASADTFLKIQKAPYRFEFIIDKNASCDQVPSHIDSTPVQTPEYLIGKNPSHYVIVIFSDLQRYADEISKEIQSIGSFLVVPPFCPWRQYGFDVMNQKLHSLIEPYKKLREKKDSPPNQIKTIALYLSQLCRGGAEKQITMLAIALAKKNKKVCLITSLADSPDVSDWHILLLKHGVERIQLPTISHNLASFEYDLHHTLLPIYGAHATYTTAQLTQALTSITPDLLISYMPDNCLIAGLAGLFSGVPKVSLSQRNIAPIPLNGNQYCYSTFAVPKDAIPYVLKELLDITGISITHNSDIGCQTYASWMGVKAQDMTVVYNGMTAPQTTNLDLKTIHDIKNDEIVIIGVMRLVEQKRPLLFLNCIKALSEKIPKLRVFLLGSGLLEQVIIEKTTELGLQNVVDLVGNYATPADYMSIADVLLHTAESEGFPNTLLEAQVMGCPIVTTNAGGTREVFCNELVNVCVSESDSTNALTLKILDMLMTDRAQFYKSHCEGVLRQYSLDALADNTIRASNIDVQGAIV